jgi:hypothetical protein
MSVSKETVDAGKTEVLMLLLARYIDRVSITIVFLSLAASLLNLLLFVRILLGEEFVSVLLRKVFNIRVMVIQHVKVYILSSDMIRCRNFLFTELKMISYFPCCCWYIYSSLYLTAFGPARCSLNNGGCWSETRNKITFSACSVQYRLTKYSVFLLFFCPFWV